MERELLTLWIIFASNGKMSELTHVYARDEAHARQQVQVWLEKRPALPEHTFRAYPSGFRFGFTTLPGSVLDDDVYEE